jgi:hypothetical protein
MRKRLNRKKMVQMEMMGLRVMMMRRMKKFLMLRRSIPIPTYTWDWREKRKENPRLVEK